MGGDARWSSGQALLSGHCVAMVLVSLLACSGREIVSAGQATTTSASVDDSESGAGTTAAPSTSADASSTTLEPGTGDVTTTEADTGCQGFLCQPDGGGAAELECDIWNQDCPAGLKCMPWANDGGGSWNATKCSPLADDPGATGEACTVEGSAISGIDDCGRGSMCWDVDRENEGYCVAFCEGDPTDPTCEDPAKFCAVLDEAVLALCLAACDPIVQSCGDGKMCCARTIEIGADFGCVPAGQNLGYTGDPCRYASTCEPGHACVPGGGGSCDDGSNCCAALCSLEEDDPNPACPDAGAGQTCVAWYGFGAAPPGLDHVGICTSR